MLEISLDSHLVRRTPRSLLLVSIVTLFILICSVLVFVSEKDFLSMTRIAVITEKKRIHEEKQSIAALPKESGTTTVDDSALAALEWIIIKSHNISDACLSDFSLSNQNNFYGQTNCQNVSLALVQDYNNYELTNMWKMVVKHPKLFDKGRQTISTCFPNLSESNYKDLVSISIGTQSLKELNLLELLETYENAWPGAYYVLPYTISVSTILKDAENLNICFLKTENKAEELITLSLARHTIMTNSFSSYFLALLSQGSARIYRNELFCRRTKNTCPEHWKKFSTPLIDNYNPQIPKLSEELVDLIGHEGKKEGYTSFRLEENDLLYRKFAGFLSYTKGEYISHPCNKTFECCGWDRGWNKTLYGNPSCARPETGKCGVFDNTLKQVVICQGGGKLCLCDKPKQQPLRWVWKGQRRGEMPQVNGKQFCDLLGSRTIYLVGDSTMQQAAAVLGNEIYRQGGDCAPQIQVHPSDNLFPIGDLNFPELKERFSSLDKIFPLIIKETDGDALVVITAGPHFNVYEHFVLMLRWVKKYITDFKQEHNDAVKENNLRILWKSQAGPHPNCGKNPTPLQTPPEPVTEIVPHTNKLKYGYWSMYPAYDLLSLGYLRDSSLDGFIDVSPLYNRPDGHAKGCFHYCIDRSQGTPLDTLLYTLYEVLLDKDSKRWLYQWD